jgi:hypothetical protein
VPKIVRGLVPTTRVIVRGGVGFAALDWVVLIFAIAGLTAGGCAAAAEAYSADAVKAEFIYRFAGYVEWPDDQPSAEPFTIGVTASDGVFAELQRLTAGRTVQNRPVEVRKISTAAELARTQILYVASDAPQSARALSTAALGRPILVVTDEAGGLVHGGIVNFVESERHVRFEISLTAAERNKLKINSGLLSVAAHVEGAKPRAEVSCWPAAVFGPASPCSRRTSVAGTNFRTSGAPIDRVNDVERGS